MEPVSDSLQTAEQVGKRLHVSPRTVLRWSRSGKLPRGIRLSPKAVRFDPAELEAAIERLRGERPDGSS
jgi:predicted DNA-binding transcriptional regulator AlpA